MTRGLCRAAAYCLPLLLTAAALAQPFTMPPPAGVAVTAPYGKSTTTETKVTIAVTSTYQQALAANTKRLSCTIQYLGANTGFVFFGAVPADTTTSFQLAQGQTIMCATATGGVLSTAVQLTATAGDVFVVSEQ